MPILNDTLVLGWSITLLLLAILSGYWFWAFYQKATRGNRDRFAPAFMLQYLSLTIFFVFLAAVIPLDPVHDEIIILCGMIATLVVLLAFALLHYEIWQERKRDSQ